MEFIDENFMLKNETGKKLFGYVKDLPIIDYHCHLSPQMVAEDHRFRSITELWLGGDHYKWRAMRSNGVDERLCTGTDTSDWEKFDAWAATVPYCFRNPLYHWTHLELKTAFGIDKRLNPETAREIFDACNDRLQNDSAMTARGLMQHYNVEVVCTTDDPVDDLHFHRQVREDGFKVKMLPAWRPDKAMAVENAANFRAYVERLSAAADVDIRTFSDFIDALQRRHDFFHEQGSRLSDHGLEEFYAENYTDSEIDVIFNKVYGGDELSSIEVRKFKSAMLYIFAVQDHFGSFTF